MTLEDSVVEFYGDGINQVTVIQIPTRGATDHKTPRTDRIKAFKSLIG